MSYDDLTVHLRMLRDRVRTEAFERTIREVVRPGHRVLDFGCGTGILAFFAARAGAKTVYAVDRASVIHVARDLARRNAVENIVWLPGDHTTVVLPEPVDVIVSEWMGHFVFAERMLEPLAAMRDKYLAPAGSMVPGSISLRAAVVTNDRIFREQSFFRDRPYGIDFAGFADWPFHHVAPERFTERDVRMPFVELGRLDMRTCSGAAGEFAGSVVLGEPATIYGFCGWFDADLGAEVRLATGPADPPTHWYQMYFPLREPLRLPADEPVRIGVRPIVREQQRRTLWTWSLTAGGRTYQMDDILQNAWLKSRADNSS